MAIHLSKIHFRPYSESEVPTEFGFDDYTPSDRFLDLSTIKFRAWEDAGYSSIGGSGSLDPSPPVEPGDGTGGTPTDPGEFVMVFNIAGSHMYAFVNPALTNTIYTRAEFYMTSAQLAAMTTGAGQFRGQIIDISTEQSDLGFWQGIFLDRRNPSNVQDGNLYLHDYWTPNSNRMLVSPDEWHVMELAIRHVSGTNYELNYKLDNVESASGWYPINMGSLINIEFVAFGAMFNDATVPSQYYLDNVSYATDDWLSETGTPIFYSDFEVGDFSEFDGTFGSPTLTSPPI